MICKAKYVYRDDYYMDETVFSCDKDLHHDGAHQAKGEGWNFSFDVDQRVTCIKCGGRMDVCANFRCFSCFKEVHLKCSKQVETRSGLFGIKFWCTTCPLPDGEE